VATPAAAQEAAVPLGLEEAVTLRLSDASNNATIVERGGAEWTPYDVAVARRFVRGDFDHAVGPVAAPTPQDGSLPEPRRIEPGTVRIRFLDLAGQHALLVIENGYGSALRYRAAIGLGNRVATTDVCVVVPNGRGTEHWPYRIDRIVLTDFRLEPWSEDSRVTCQ